MACKIFPGSKSSRFFFGLPLCLPDVPFWRRVTFGGFPPPTSYGFFEISPEPLLKLTFHREGRKFPFAFSKSQIANVALGGPLSVPPTCRAGRSFSLKRSRSKVAIGRRI